MQPTFNYPSFHSLKISATVD